MLEFIAFCDHPTSRLKLLQELVPVLQKTLARNDLGQKDVAPHYRTLREREFIAEVYHGITVPEIVSERALRDAISSGRCHVYLQSPLAHEREHSRRYGIHQLRLLQRQIRDALYSNATVEMFHAYDLYLKEIDNYRYEENLPLADILCASADFSFLTTGPRRFFLKYLPDALTMTQRHHRQAYSFVDPLLSLIEKCIPLSVLDSDDDRASALELMLLFVGECWLSGEMDRVDEVIHQMTGYHQRAAAAVRAFAENNVEMAVSLFNDALHEMRRITKKKRLFFNSVIGEILIYAYLRHDTPETVVQLKTLLADAAARTNKSRYQEVFAAFEKLVSARLSPDRVEPLPIYHFRRDDHASLTQSISRILAATLFDVAAVRENEKVAEKLENTFSLLAASPHTQTLSNLRALQRHIADVPIIETEDDDWPAPTFDFSNNAAEWKLVLYNISRIGREAPEAAAGPVEQSARLAFRVTWSEWNDRWQVGAYVQKRQKSGVWTRGKYFNPKKRLDIDTDTSFFTPTDERILMILEREGEKREVTPYDSYTENHNEALFLLSGHPHVTIGESRLVPLEIDTAQPQVEVVSVESQIEVRITPSTPCERGFHIEKRNANRLLVTRFSSAQMALLEAIGKNGARFPVSARAEITEAISEIGRVVEVHSHVADIGRKSEGVDARLELLIRMQPFQRGLSAQFLIAPLGPDGPSFFPGHGPPQVFATIDGQKRTTLRPLKQESERLDNLLLALGLYYSVERSEGLYQFTEEGDAIEFLSELENCKETPGTPPFVVEWPRGIKLKCSRTLFPKDFHLLVNKKRKWLELSGKLRVEGKDIYNIAELLAAEEGPRPEYLRFRGDRFLRLSKSLRRFLANLSGIGVVQSDGTLIAPDSSAIAVKKLADEVGEFDANESWKKKVSELDDTLSEDARVPRQVKAKLREYQTEGFRWLQRLSSLGLGACLADDMGLGKTLQTLVLMQHRLRGRVGSKPALVVAPVSVIPGWLQEGKRFVPSLPMVAYEGTNRQQLLDRLKPGQVLVTSYGLLQRDGAQLSKIEFDTIVLDEAQFIKNKDSARARAAFKLQADFKMVTTGTPVENRLSEYWSIFNFINPGLLGSHKLFLNTYEKQIQRFGDGSALAALRWQTRPFLLRRTKEEILDELPPKTEIVRYCEMSRDEAAFYEMKRSEARRILKLSESSAQMMELITALTTLRQAACHPGLIEPGLSMVESAKLSCLKDILLELKEGGHRALIFSQFVKFLSIVKKWVGEAGFTFQYLDGRTAKKKRTAAIEAFQNGKSDLFLISTRAGGFGLNLTAADYVVHLDPWWNPAVEDQASDRVHRIGQTRPVTVYKIVTRGTVEEKVVQIHGEKRELARGLLEDTDQVARLNIRDLLELI